MKSVFSKTLILVIALAALMAAPSSAEACTVCFGGAESDAVQGVAWAIIFLGAVVMSVMGCVGGFFVFIAKRAASVNPDTDPKADAAEDRIS